MKYTLALPYASATERFPDRPRLEVVNTSSFGGRGAEPEGRRSSKVLDGVPPADQLA